MNGASTQTRVTEDRAAIQNDASVIGKTTGAHPAYADAWFRMASAPHGHPSTRSSSSTTSALHKSFGVEQIRRKAAGSSKPSTISAPPRESFTRGTCTIPMAVPS